MSKYPKLHYLKTKLVQNKKYKCSKYHYLKDQICSQFQNKMKRKQPFLDDPFTIEKDFLSSKSQSFFKKQPSINKFNSCNIDCNNFLYLPKILSVDIFPEIIRKIPLFLLDSNISVGVSTSKPIMCNLLHGSPLIANKSFGMEIERLPHVSAIEHSTIRLSHLVEQCVKSSYIIKTKINIEIKQNKIYINDKTYEFGDKKNEEGNQFTPKISIDSYYSVIFELNKPNSSIYITFYNKRE